MSETPHKDRCRSEMTRDVIFLFQRKVGRHWHTESVWLDRVEAELWGNANKHRFNNGWQVYGVPAEGALAKMLQQQDEGASMTETDEKVLATFDWVAGREGWESPSDEPYALCYEDHPLTFSIDEGVPFLMDGECVTQEPTRAHVIAAEKAATDEKVLCVGRELVSGVLDADAPDADKLATLLAGKVYRNRHTPNGNDPDVEHDDRYKQLIPGIVVVNSKGKILTYNRGWKGGEDRLKGKWTCLFGGHVNNQDATFDRGIIREIREELSGPHVDVLGWDCLDDDDDGKAGMIHGPIGFINDNSDPVGQHHTGVVYILRADEVVPRENPEWQWYDPELIEVAEHIPGRLENWARLALPMVREWMEAN